MKQVNICNDWPTLRKKYGVSQEEFAFKISVSRQTVSNWEQGKGKPTLDNYHKAMEAFKLFKRRHKK